MIYHDFAQQSEEWYRARLGVATASCFDKIITPKKLELSKSAEDYAFTLVGEMVTGESAEKFQSYWMERGFNDVLAAFYTVLGFGFFE